MEPPRSRKPCRYVQTNRKCRYGQACRFAHAPVDVKLPNCRYFSTERGCRYGNACKFQHCAPQLLKQTRKYTWVVSSSSKEPDQPETIQTQLIATCSLQVARTNSVAGDYLQPPQCVWQLYGDDDSLFTAYYRVSPESKLQKLDGTLEVVGLTIGRLDNFAASAFQLVHTRLRDYRAMIDYLYFKTRLFEVALLIGHYHGFQRITETRIVSQPYTIHGN